MSCAGSAGEVGEVGPPDAEEERFKKWMLPKQLAASVAANIPEEKARVNKDLFENYHVYQTEFGEVTNSGGWLSSLRRGGLPGSQ